MTEPITGTLVGAERRSEPDELEAGLNALIERRARDVDPEEKEESWKESERQYRSERREANRYAWCSYYRRLARNLRTSAEHFEGKAAALSEEVSGM